MIKYLVNITYIQNDDDTFRYARNCNEFSILVNNSGILFKYPAEGTLDQLKIDIKEILTKYSTLYEITTMKEDSFNVEVFKLNGLNLQIVGIIPSKFEDELELLYNGPLKNLKTN